MEFSGLRTQRFRLGQKIDDAIGRVLGSCNFIQGDEVAALEEQLARYTGAKHCIACANGTDAMTLAMMAWGVGKDDAVFLPAFTFAATAEVVALRGAVPVFVDVDDTFCLSPDLLERAISRVKREGKLRPVGVIAVDLFGLPADYQAIGRIARENGLWVLEDGAQGFGGERFGRRACSFGEIATTSFFPAKPLGCYGDGGALFTDDHRLAQTLQSLRCHGRGEDKYDNEILGLNSRLDELQAAILSVKFEAFERDELEARRNLASFYTEELAGLLKVPQIPEGANPSWAQYTVRLPGRGARDRLKKHLQEQNIPSAVYYPRPLHLQGAFRYLGGRRGDCPLSERLCDEVLSLPMHPYLCCGEMRRVTRAIGEFISGEGEG